MAETLFRLAKRIVLIAVWLAILAPPAPRADDDSLSCKIDEVEFPDLTDSKKVSAQGCKPAYYELCEKLVERAQDKCDDTCRNFYTRSKEDSQTFRICKAKSIETSIDAFDQPRHCKLVSENVVVNCTLAYECECGG